MTMNTRWALTTTQLAIAAGIQGYGHADMPTASTVTGIIDQQTFTAAVQAIGLASCGEDRANNGHAAPVSETTSSASL